MKFSKMFECNYRAKKRKYDKEILSHVNEIMDRYHDEVTKKAESDEHVMLYDREPEETEVRKEVRKPEPPAKSEEQPYDKDRDYFLDDDVYNTCKKSISDKLNIDFEPDSYDKDTEVPDNSIPKDYFLSDEYESSISESAKPKKPKKSRKKTISEESRDSKELKNMVNDVDVKDIDGRDPDQEAMKIYNELIDMIQDKDYDDSVDFVDDIVKDPKLKFLLSLGFGGEFSNLKLKIKKKIISAKKLIPTQNEIGTESTLKYILKGNSVDICFEKSTVIKKPIVTFQGTFIVDGHHRWSQIFVTNPNANLECIDIDGDLSPLSMLKAVQCTIASNLGHLIRNNISGSNLYDMSEKQIEKYIRDNIEDTAVENLSKYYENPINALVKNVIQMQRNNTPILNAPDRGEMPQTSKDPDLFDDLKAGVTDV